MPFLEQMQVNRWYSNFGPLVTQFEMEILQRVVEDAGAGAGFHAVSFSSATAALELVLRAKGFPAGSKVLVPALTFPATALAVLNAGHIPVIADVEEASWCLGIAHARTALEQYPDLKAVMPVAAFGRPIDTKKWLQFQLETEVDVVCDAAAALGQQTVIGGVDTIFSLHATKPFGVGEGGLLITSNKELAETVRSLSNFGFSRAGTGEVLAVGSNAKMGEYYAAVGLAQLRRIDSVMERRRMVLDAYIKALEPLGNRVRLQDGTGAFIPAVLCVDVDGRAAEVGKALEQAGILHRRWYLPPLHQHAAFREYPQVELSPGRGLPVSEYCCNGLIGLPFHAFLSADDVVETSSLVDKIVGN